MSLSRWRDAARSCLQRRMLYRHVRSYAEHVHGAWLWLPTGPRRRCGLVPSPHTEEPVLLQKRVQGASAIRPHTLGTTDAGCQLCLNHGPPILPEITPRRVLGGGMGRKTLGDDQGGGTTMRSPTGDDRMPPRRFEAARVELRCRVNAAHARQLILEHATIYTDGWASWAEDGHVYTGYVQTGPCCDPPEVSAL